MPELEYWTSAPEFKFPGLITASTDLGKSSRPPRSHLWTQGLSPGEWSEGHGSPGEGSMALVLGWSGGCTKRLSLGAIAQLAEGEGQSLGERPGPRVFPAPPLERRKR